MKEREVLLYKWRLCYKKTKEIYSEHFVVDRGDNKRRKTNELKKILFALNNIEATDNFTICGYNPFKGYAKDYGCKV